jgi:hypothetical protein
MKHDSRACKRRWEREVFAFCSSKAYRLPTKSTGGGQKGVTDKWTKQNR